MSVQQGGVDLRELAGTVCVVTGSGNNGIGYGIAEVAAQKGMDVVLMDLHTSVVKAAEFTLQRAYPAVKVLSAAADVTKESDMKAAAAWISLQFPAQRIGAVFANAGVIFPSKGILNSKPEQWKVMLDVNIVGVLHTVQAFAPYLKASTAPSILCTTASIGGLVRGEASVPGYCATKHAVVAMTESLSFELARSHPQIRVHVCCPCIVGTGLFRTSQTSMTAVAGSEVKAHQLDSEEQEGISSGIGGLYTLGMTPKRHGEQVWDRIAAGEFYMITDNVRPYVDHDYPFGGQDMVLQRFAAIRQQPVRKIDNAGAFRPERAAMVGPLSREARRRLKALNSKL